MNIGWRSRKMKYSILILALLTFNNSVLANCSDSKLSAEDNFASCKVDASKGDAEA